MIKVFAEELSAFYLELCQEALPDFKYKKSPYGRTYREKRFSNLRVGFSLDINKKKDEFRIRVNLGKGDGYPSRHGFFLADGSWRMSLDLSSEALKDVERAEFTDRLLLKDGRYKFRNDHYWYVSPPSNEDLDGLFMTPKGKQFLKQTIAMYMDMKGKGFDVTDELSIIENGQWTRMRSYNDWEWFQIISDEHLGASKAREILGPTTGEFENFVRADVLRFISGLAENE